MPQVIIDGTYQIRIIWGLSGADWAVNVLHARLPGADGVNQALADGWGTDLAAAHTSSGLAAAQPAVIDLDRVELQDLRTANQPLISSDIGSPGTNVTDLLPRRVGLVVTLRTALAGRSFRGRSYVPGWAEDQNDGTGRASASAVTAAEAWISDIETAAANRGHDLAVASLIKNGVFSPSSAPVTQSLVRDNIWDAQRRRAYNGI